MKNGLFKGNPLDPATNFSEDTRVDRAAITLWPQSKAFEIALRFGLDQALDVAERDSQINCSLETRRSQVQRLLAYCEKNPQESWFANHRSKCSDLRCDVARKVSLPVASSRALINLCLQWNLLDCGVQLINVLFSNSDRVFYRCCGCCMVSDTFFVGGVRSNAVAAALADLIVMIGWESAGINNIIQRLDTNKNFAKQAGQLAHLAICLFHAQCFVGAQYISNEAYAILTTKYLKDLNSSTYLETEPKLSTLMETVASVIDMLVLIDGPSVSEQTRLDRLHVKLKSLKLPQKGSPEVSFLEFHPF